VAPFLTKPRSTIKRYQCHSPVIRRTKSDGSMRQSPSGRTVHRVTRAPILHEQRTSQTHMQPIRVTPAISGRHGGPAAHAVSLRKSERLDPESGAHVGKITKVTASPQPTPGSRPGCAPADSASLRPVRQSRCRIGAVIEPLNRHFNGQLSVLKESAARRPPRAKKAYSYYENRPFAHHLSGEYLTSVALN
jgi:hypothetical protein